MIPVEQRGDSDCQLACLASILELPYEAVPQTIADPELQQQATIAFLRERGLFPWYVGLWGIEYPMMLHGSEHLEHLFAPSGYWIGGVLSPRLTDADGNPAEHAVVMKGRMLVYDPHPRRDMGHLGFQSATVLMLSDPA